MSHDFQIIRHLIHWTICVCFKPFVSRLNHSTFHWTICICHKAFVNDCVKSYLLKQLRNRAADRSLSIILHMVYWWIIIWTNRFLFLCCRFKIYQWTASNLTKSFVPRRTISHKSTGQAILSILEGSFLYIIWTIS